MSAEGWTTGRLAEHVGARCEGPADRAIGGVSSLARAGEGDLAFCTGGRWRAELASTSAGAVVLDEGEVPEGVVALRHSRPRWAFARLASVIRPQRLPEPGVHPLAVVDPAAHIHPTATVEALAVVRAGAVLGPRAWVQSHAYVGEGAITGADCRLMPGSRLLHGCVLGDRVRLHPGAVVGGDGFGYAPGPDGLTPVPQLGIAVIEDDVDVGVNSAIDRAALDETRVGSGTRLDNFVHIAHGVRTGAECLLAAFAAVSGGATLGDRVVLAGRSAVIEHVDVGDDAVLLGMAAATRGVAAGTKVGGAPARHATQWAREQVALRGLPAAMREVDRLKRTVDELQAVVRERAALEQGQEPNR